MKQKAFFMIFQGLSVPRNCLRPETAPLKEDFKEDWILKEDFCIISKKILRAAILWGKAARV